MKQIIGILVVIVIVLGLVLYCNNRGTDDEIKEKVDTQYHELCLKLIKVSNPNETNFQEYAVQLDSIRWQEIEDGGRYEKKKKELFKEEKKRIAEKIRDIYNDTETGGAPRIIAFPKVIEDE